MLRAFITAIALVSSSALASETGAATLGAPTHVSRVVADGAVWGCDGVTCVGPTSARVAAAVAACTAVADSAGKVSAFTVGALTFGDHELARCNRHIKS